MYTYTKKTFHYLIYALLLFIAIITIEIWGGGGINSQMMPPVVSFPFINLPVFHLSSPQSSRAGKDGFHGVFFSFRDLQFRLNELNMPRVGDKIMSRFHRICRALIQKQHAKYLLHGPYVLRCCTE